MRNLAKISEMLRSPIDEFAVGAQGLSEDEIRGLIGVLKRRIDKREDDFDKGYLAMDSHNHAADCEKLVFLQKITNVPAQG